MGALAASAAMLLAVLTLRAADAARERRERPIVARWYEVFAQCAAGAPPAAPTLHRGDGYLFLRLWNAMQESLRGEAKERLNSLARNAGADRLAAAYLTSRDVRKELIGILTLGNLREPGAGKAMEARVTHRLPVVSLRAAQALVRIEGERALPLVLRYAAERVDWPLPRIINLLRELDPTQVSGHLAQAIEGALLASAAPERATRLLRLHDTAQPEVLRPAVQRALATAHEAETLAAALAALRDPDDIAYARRLVAHAAWPVRLQAAYAIRRVGSLADLPLLSRLLGDPSWWVRYRAAQAIVAFPGLSATQVAEIGAGLSDRFASDALRQAAAEQERA
ncbi:MAG TPA: HEAT repeat domain-containing protein [Burkholderiales bacterium]